MKNLTLLIAFCFLVFSSKATTFRFYYPGMPVVGYDFTYWPDLINAANNGDTVQIYQQYFPSAQVIDVSKNLKIFGYGYSLNTNTGFQALNLPDSSSQRALNIHFAGGSSGSLAQGLFLNAMRIEDSSITVKRCKIYGDYSNCAEAYIGHPYYCCMWVSNTTIEGCYFKGVNDTINAAGNTCGLTINPVYSEIRNLKFVNNIVDGAFIINAGSNSFPVTGLIANNIFMNKRGKQSSEWMENLFEIRSSVSALYVKNNIFYYDSLRTIQDWGQSYYPSQVVVNGNSIFLNNVSNIPASYNLWGATNQWGVSNLFSAGFNNGYYTSESSLQLAVGSPALTVGKNNAGTTTPCGVFGGESGQVYKLSGIPAIPAIYQLTAPSNNATTNPYNITTSTRSNN